MLRSLYIKNFALIDDIILEFEPGLNILTGETGAGKSILLDAVQVALGGRASAEYIRAGTDKAIVQVAFQPETSDVIKNLEDLGIEISGEEVLVLSREISRNGRNWCRVNGQVVTLSGYRQAGSGLVDLHGQHQQQSLLHLERYLDLLDSYGGEQVIQQRSKVEKHYHQWQKAQTKLQQMQSNDQDLARQIDVIKFQVQEIENAQLTAGEDQQLINERKLLANAEKISALANTVYQNLYDGANQQKPAATELIDAGVNALRELAGYDQKLIPLLKSLEETLYVVEDTAREVAQFIDGVEYDAQRLDYIEKRIDEINHLKRKYGDSVAEILRYHQNMLEQLTEITGGTEQLSELQQKLVEYRQLWEQEAQVLSSLRHDLAVKIQKGISQELKDLEMGKVKFEIVLEILDKPTAKGIDSIQFLISTNPGEPLKSLHKIASGGELSRFMLAMKSLLAGTDKIATLIFDELDTGVGGRALYAVGQKMSQISKYCQVITVTHAPQVASFADNHFLIKKEVVQNKTYTKIFNLDDQGRLNELARMLGGKEATGVALEHAASMIKASSQKPVVRDQLKI
ncbi:DNA repair protein RecN [Peptococcaceae bacterium]|nr:DNA repair protein RecN [Peptococcaceae bacterium]